ncbi:hypothetical protein AUP07_1187 [methanogenic archaeon mixed culture ISO4-G1]|nr:hypothetical protein AUP07_1187 [methanogenic archaeon mixed culture ISO4-G1]
MAFNPYEQRNEYNVQDLLSQIEEYKDRHGEECEYVRCEHRNADYSVMDRQQKAYYLYWRDELSRGTCLKSDRGYVKLRLCEIINSDMDPKDGMRELRLLFDNSRMHGMPQSDLAATMFDYAVVHDLDLPTMWMGKGSVRSFMITSEIMSFPTRRIGKELVWYLSGGPKMHADGVDSLRHISLFNDSLTAIDRFLMENTGKGVAQTYSEGMVTELYKVFLYLPYGKDKDYQITYEKLRTDGVFGEFMLGLFSYTRKVLCKDIGEKGPATPSSFNKEFRAIVDRIHEEGPGDFEKIPKAWRGTNRQSMSSKERALVDMGASLEAQFGTAEKPKAILNIDKEAQKQHVSPHLKTDIERNWNVEVKERCEYIPSGFTNPDYRSFSEPQRKFYVYWRDQTRKGNYGETDRGYLWLYLCELVNIKADPQVNMDQLVGLRRAYGGADEDNLIGKTCFEYSLVHKLAFPDPSIYESNITACLVMEQFLKGMDTHPDKTLLLFLSGINDKTMSREFDQDCVGITCAMLRAVEKAMEDQGTTIEEFCDPEKVPTVVTVFEDLKYFKEIRKARFTYRNYIYNAAFDDSLKEIVKNVFSAVRMKRTGKAVKINKFTAFGMECREMLTKAVSSWYEGKEIAEIKERASNLKLDREAVTGAETALKDVTRMMATEEVQEEVVMRPVEPVRKISDSWQGLAEALDEKQKGYLRAVLEGNGQQYLRDIGSIQSRMEDSINALAMDAVGDNILEGGVIFDEYTDNVRALL